MSESPWDHFKDTGQEAPATPLHSPFNSDVPLVGEGAKEQVGAQHLCSQDKLLPLLLKSSPPNAPPRLRANVPFE